LIPPSVSKLFHPDIVDLWFIELPLAQSSGEMIGPDKGRPPQLNELDPSSPAFTALMVALFWKMYLIGQSTPVVDGDG
jgi:hypothetical protein